MTPHMEELKLISPSQYVVGTRRPASMGRPSEVLRPGAHGLHDQAPGCGPWPALRTEPPWRRPHARRSGHPDEETTGFGVFVRSAAQATCPWEGTWQVTGMSIRP